MDNRPLKWEEFLERIGQTVYLSATPGRTSWARPTASSSSRSSARPAWSTPRSSSSRPRARSTTWCTRSALRTEKDERVLVTTLTKKMAEDLTDYLLEHGIRVRYLHSEVDTLRRVELLRELRTGEYDVLVGINLLREGLDLPEVSLVAILDADKEGFLRSGTSLIQTIGRAARNVSGQVHMYADKITPSMAQRDRRDQPPPRQAGRLQRRRTGIDPQPLRKKIDDILDDIYREDEDTEQRARLGGGGGRQMSRGKAPVPGDPQPAAAAPAAHAGRAAMARGRAGRADPGADRPDARPPPGSCSSSWPPGCATRSPS